MNIREILVRFKDNNPYLRYLWLSLLAKRGDREKKMLSDIECINKLYYHYSNKLPDLENPMLFSEKMQWMKLHYRNELMPVVADKYLVRQYLQDLGYGYLLNDLIAVYEDVRQIKIENLPNSFVLKASHASGWNLVVKDKSEFSWHIWRKHFHYWLTHGIEWNGREWHYAKMKPRIVCEKYLEDNSGALVDYKFYCFDGEPKFLQVNVGRGTRDSTQNYYDLNWNLLPFGKSQPHNPQLHIEKPLLFDEMIRLAHELTSPFPYVRLDLYEANGRIYFGEYTFFPCSGMPDFIPSEYDAIVGDMLTLPKSNV